MTLVSDGVYYLADKAARFLGKIEPPMPFFLMGGVFAGLDFLNAIEKASLDKIQAVCCKVLTDECGDVLTAQGISQNVTTVCSGYVPTELLIRNIVIISCSTLCVASVLCGLGVTAKILYDEHIRRKMQRPRSDYIELV